MAALVLIFILLLSTQFLELKKQSSLASEYRDKKQAIVKALREEFRDDFERWNAEFDEQTLMIRFPQDVAFMPNSAELRPRFRAILNDFFHGISRCLPVPSMSRKSMRSGSKGIRLTPGRNTTTGKDTPTA
jgi:hypothetical protein